MIGIQIADSTFDVVAELREGGLILPPAGADVVRFLPALTATKQDFDKALEIFSAAVRERATANNATV